MIEDSLKSLREVANIIPNWDTMNKNDLINGYIDNEQNLRLKDAYFAAIVCRYSHNIFKYYNGGKGWEPAKNCGFTIEDCYDWLLDAIMYILEARKWRDPSNSLYNDKNAPDKCMNRAIYSTRQRYFYLSNRALRKTNYGGNKTSLDNMTEDNLDHLNILEDDNFSYSSEGMKSAINFKSLLTNYLKNGDYLKAVILDIICNENPFTMKKVSSLDAEGEKIDKFNFKFSKKDLNRAIRNYSPHYLQETVTVDNKILYNVLDKLKAQSDLKLSKIITHIFEDFKTDKELLKYLNLSV